MRPNEALISEEVVSIQKSINHTYKTAQSYRKCFKTTDAAQAKRITNVARTCTEHGIRPKMTDGCSKTELAMMHDYTTNKQIHDRIQISRRTLKRGADGRRVLCIVCSNIHSCIFAYVLISSPRTCHIISFQCICTHENFNAPFYIPFAYPPFHISLHPLVHPVHICLIWFIAPLSNAFNDVNTGCTKRHAHPGSHIWLRFCQSLAEFCSYTCCSHSCAYFLRYSGRSIGQLASDSAGVGRTWLSKHCLVYSIWFFVHV